MGLCLTRSWGKLTARLAAALTHDRLQAQADVDKEGDIYCAAQLAQPGRVVAADGEGRLRLALFERGSLKWGLLARPVVGITSVSLKNRGGEGGIMTLRAPDTASIAPGTYDALLLIRRRHPIASRLPYALVCLALIASGLNLRPWHDPRAQQTPTDTIATGEDAEVGFEEMAISVASHMSLSEGETLLEARIENPRENHCDQRVTVYEAGKEDDVLFSSGALAPGECLPTIELTHPLSVGTHTLTVEFQGYERKLSLVSAEGKALDHSKFGASCAAEVTLEVLAA